MRLLVSTDISANSKRPIRFAKTPAKQTDIIKVFFYHAIHIMKPTKWSDVFFKRYKDEEKDRFSADIKS